MQKPAAAPPPISPINIPPVSTVVPPVPTTEPPSYASTMQALAMQKGISSHSVPPPPYGNDPTVKRAPLILHQKLEIFLSGLITSISFR